MQKFNSLLVLITVLLTGCQPQEPEPVPTAIDYKQEMRTFVESISAYAKGINPNFAVIPQNGVELISVTGDDSGAPDMTYINAIDGIGQESLNFGYNADDQETPTEEHLWTKTFLDMANNNGSVQIMVTDYCSTPSKMDHSYTVNHTNGYISFAADHRELDNIPDYPSPVYNENTAVITHLHEAQNFLYLINPDNFFTSKQAFVDAVTNTNYDCIIMDFFYDGEAFTESQIEALKQKANGGQRLLISYMSIGEAENYRYYWHNDWTIGNPSFIEGENPNWQGNYIVQYWNPAWQAIIFGNDDSYLKKILDAGFDGVYLDIIDGFENFENE